MKQPLACLLVLGLLLSYLLSFQAGAQQWAFDPLGTDRGLPASETYNMIEDERGYVCVATEYGIVKYNGNRFVPICTNIPLRERVAYAFNKNGDGSHYFVNSQFHIYSIKNDSAFRLQIRGKVVPVIPHHSPIRYLFADTMGDIYASTPYENFKYDAAKALWISLKNNGVATNTVEIEQIQNNYLCRFRNSKIDKIIIRNIPFNGVYNLNVRDVVPILNVKEVNGGLYMFGKKQLIYITKEKKLLTFDTRGNILSLKVSANGHIWVGIQYGGLLELDSNLRPVHRYLQNLSIADILFDKQEGVWVTSLEQGVFHCRDMHEYHYDNMKDFSGGICLLKIINNRLFVGSFNGKMLIIGPEGNRIKELGQHPIQDVIPWLQGYLVANTSSVSFLSPSSHASTVVPQVASYLIAHKGEGFLCVSPTAFFHFSRNYRQKHFLPIRAKIKCLLPLDDDSFLAGSTKGLWIFKDGQLLVPKALHQLRNSTISDLEKSKDGNIWISTKGDGLFRLSENRYLLKMPTPSDIITNVSFYKDSIMLLSTNIGLYTKVYKSNKSEWRSLYEGEIINAIPYHNKIFIGTKHGLIAHDTANLFNPPSYAIYLSSVSAGGRKISMTDIEVAHRDRDLYFNFDILSYKRHAPQLYYRLDGPIPSKGQISGTQLFFQNLNPGQYKLHVFIGNTMKQSSLIVPFYVRPAFWQRGIFLIFVIIAGLCLLAFCAFLLHKNTKRSAYKKAAIQRMLSEYKLTALKAQINPHFISNSLTAIQQLVLSGEVDKAGRYLALFSQLIRQVLHYSDKSLVLLQDELKIIELNIALEQLRFSNQFHFDLQIAADVNPLALYIPPLITQPFIENAIWHGLLPLKDRRSPKLLITISKEEGRLILSIIDNGVGREISLEQTYVPNNKMASRGIELSQSRIENLNHLYIGGKASIAFTDLYEDAVPTGTQVDIVLPYLSDVIYDNNYKESHY